LNYVKEKDAFELNLQIPLEVVMANKLENERTPMVHWLLKKERKRFLQERRALMQRKPSGVEGTNEEKESHE
jgi:hypothetical protein